MPEPIPLFPLNVVLVPGLVLPLHIFEPRYRDMVQSLLRKPDPQSREFGIATVREGRSFDGQGMDALYPTGTAAVLREVTELPDGRFDILTTGTRRFRLLSLQPSQAGSTGGSGDLAVATVEFLEDVEDPGDELIARRARKAFDDYRRLLGGRLVIGDGEHEDLQDLPDDPTVLSYLITAAIVVSWSERQDLLAADDTATRLRRAIGLLERENGIIAALGAVPAVDALGDPGSVN